MQLQNKHAESEEIWKIKKKPVYGKTARKKFKSVHDKVKKSYRDSYTWEPSTNCLKMM